MAELDRSTRTIRVTIAVARVFGNRGLPQYARMPEPGFMHVDYFVEPEEADRLLAVARVAYCEERSHVKKALRHFLEKHGDPEMCAKIAMEKKAQQQRYEAHRTARERENRLCEFAGLGAQPGSIAFTRLYAHIVAYRDEEFLNFLKLAVGGGHAGK